MRMMCWTRLDEMKSKLIIGVMWNDEEVLNEAIEELKKEFGAVEKESFTYDFSLITDYYEEEMGKNLNKKWLVFKELVEMDDLAAIKLKTGDIEKGFSTNNKRKINIDPGYITHEQFILASLKGSAHKIHLHSGVWAHLIYVLTKTKCIEFGRTFPDLRKEEMQKFLLEVRNSL